MKFLFNTLLLTGVLFGQELFDPYEVRMMDIYFYNADYDSILQAQWDAHDKSYELATIVVNGDTLDSVGVRYKGSSTYYYTLETDSPKFPLNIDVDLVHEDQSLWGYNKIKLSSSIFDPTFVRETLGYLTESTYLPTSQTGYMNVTINDELMGLYISVESVNKPFLSKHFGNKDGSFFKCEPQSQFGEEGWVNPDLRWYGSDSTLDEYQLGYELKSDAGWNDLLELIYTLNFDMNNIESILNVDRVLWFFAASTVIPDLDTYNGFWIHNYYIYKNITSGQFEIIPWDKDHSFGGALVNFVDSPQDIYEWDPFIFEGDNSRPLFNQLISVPIYKKYFSAHIRSILNDIYNVNDIQSLAYGLQDGIETYAANDPNLFPLFGTGQYFQYNVDNFLVTGFGLDFCGIVPTVEARRTYLLAHEEISKVAPLIGDVFQSIDTPEAGQTVIITAEVTGATSVELMATTSHAHTHFSAIDMLDDGQHNDGEAGDGLYGAIFPFDESGSTVHYYIRAQNDDAIMLDPELAEKEFYAYTIQPNSAGPVVVINEINYNSADNFDSNDWVEIYNPMDHSLDLSQWIFKDENDDHIFQLPHNTTLESNQYLVLCKDSEAFSDFYPFVTNYVGDLGFGLSGGGELIRLFDSSGILIDFVEYDDSSPWPESPDGNGPTLELLNPILDNALAENWAASNGNGSPGNDNTTFVSTDEEIIMPNSLSILGNYPNPFNPTTTIRFNIPGETPLIASLHIYDLNGRLVKTLIQSKMMPGIHDIKWNATNMNNESVANGIYLISLQMGTENQTGKMIYLK
ncbi:MAG: CotH kinase family protein [Candidatus Marinimicrobia bacterium]|nr:CotH kinase family protein [Candidatus Neomarinimicrobiota bacterium]